jgi:hypothetical protein
VLSDCGCRGVVRLAHPQVLWNHLHQTGFEVTALVTVQLSRCFKVAGKAGHKDFFHSWSLLVGDSVGHQPLGKLVRSDHELSVPLATLWEGACYINHYPLEWGALTLYWCIRPRPLVCRLWLAVQTSQSWHHFSTSFLPGKSNTFVWPCSESCWHPGILLTVHAIEFGQYVFHLTPREGYLRYFRSSAGGLPVALLYAVPYSEGFPLGPVAVVRGASAGNVVPFRTLSSLYLFWTGPMSNPKPRRASLIDTWQYAEKLICSINWDDTTQRLQGKQGRKKH